jgi:hypothetical protein
MDINKAIESMWAIVKPQIATTIRGGFKVVAGMIGGWGALKNPGSQEQFIDLGTALVLYLIGQGWSWWQASGQDFVKAQFEVIQAKTLAQAQKLRTAGIPQVTVKEIALQAPTMTLAETAKVIPTLPAEIQANISPTPAAKIVAILAILIASMFLAGLDSASAQVKLKTPAQVQQDIKNAFEKPLTTASNEIVSALSKPLQDLADFLVTGLDDAATLAVAIPDLQDGNGQACWLAMAATGKILKEHPVPLTLKVAADLESFRLLNMAANKICQNAACTQVFTEAGNLVNAASPVPLALPNLTALCSKVPQIAMVAAQVPAVSTSTSPVVPSAPPLGGPLSGPLVPAIPETSPSTSAAPAKP